MTVVMASLALAVVLAVAGCGSSAADGAAGETAGATPAAGASTTASSAAASAASPDAAVAKAAARALVGRTFPAGRAKDLTGAWVSIPRDWRGSPLIVLVTPSKESQPDADQWIARLLTQDDAQFRETPIIDSSIAHAMAGFIKKQMKGGLPRDMWVRVIPVFEGASDMKRFFGDLGQTVAWVAVLDDAGVIRSLHVGGFSDAAADEALARVDELQ